MKYILLFLFFLPNYSALSQGATVLHKAEIGKLPEATKFAFIEPATDSSNFTYVALIRGKDMIRKANIENVYFEIRKKANKLGANCFKFKSYETDSANGEVIMLLEAYYANDSIIQINKANHEKNVVFILGGEKKGGKPVSLKINDEPKEIISGTYKKIKLQEGDKVKLNKGGSTGATMFLHYQEDSQPVFYTLSGFGLSELERQPANGVSFKTGGIDRVSNISLGLLITHLLEQAE